jgi:hypothetical protein
MILGLAIAILATTLPAIATSSPTPSVAAPAIATPPPAVATPPPARFTAALALKYGFNEQIYNELSPGPSAYPVPFSKPSVVTYAAEMSVIVKGRGRDWLVKYRFDQFQYRHLSNFLRAPPGYCPDNLDPGCVTVIGANSYAKILGYGQGYVPSFTATEFYSTLDLMGQVCSSGCPYLGVSYMQKALVYNGYPVIGGVGVALTLPAASDRAISPYGSLNYYPFVSGTYDGPTGRQFGSLSGEQFVLAYSVLRYDLGISVRLFRCSSMQVGRTGIFGHLRDDSPSSYTLADNYVGLSVPLTRC